MAARYWWKVIPFGERLRFIPRLFVKLVEWPVSWVVRLIPRNAHWWAFGNFKGYMDNPAYFHRYVLEQGKGRGIRPIWFYRGTKPSGVTGEAYDLKSLRGKWMLTRCGVAVLSNGGSDLNGKWMSGAFVLNFWHGNPIKRLLGDKQRRWVGWAPFNRIIDGLCRSFARQSAKRYTITTVCSAEERGKLMTAFGLPAERFATIGVPRYDIYKRRLDQRKGSSAKPYNVLLAPTWRERREQERAVIEDYLRVTRLVKRQDVLFYLKFHPTAWDDVTLSDGAEGRVKRFEGTYGQDINEALPEFDLLISDYSSCIYDYLSFSNLCISFFPDLHRSKASNELYLCPEEIDGVQAFERAELLADWIDRHEFNNAQSDYARRPLLDGRCNERAFELLGKTLQLW